MSSSFTSVRTALVVCAAALSLAACGATQPQSTVSRSLDSGVTSNNGGGMAQPNYGATAPVRVQ